MTSKASTTTAPATGVVIDGARMRPWPPFAKRGAVTAWHVVVPASEQDAALAAGTLDHVLRRAERTDETGALIPAVYVDGVQLTGALHTYSNGRTVKYDDDGIGHVRLIMVPRETPAPASKAPASKAPASKAPRTASKAPRATVDGALA